MNTKNIIPEGGFKSDEVVVIGSAITAHGMSSTVTNVDDHSITDTSLAPGAAPAYEPRYIDMRLCTGVINRMRRIMDIVKTNPDVPDPSYATDGSGALDLYANITETITIQPGGIAEIGTGIKANIPDEHLGLLCPRSGKGSKGLSLRNTIGFIDSDYHGEILAKIRNTGDDVLTIEPFEKFVQLAIVPVLQVAVRVVDELPVSARGENGFGSTGK